MGREGPRGPQASPMQQEAGSRALGRRAPRPQGPCLPGHWPLVVLGRIPFSTAQPSPAGTGHSSQGDRRPWGAPVSGPACVCTSVWLSETKLKQRPPGLLGLAPQGSVPCPPGTRGTRPAGQQCSLPAELLIPELVEHKPCLPARGPGTPTVPAALTTP